MLSLQSAARVFIASAAFLFSGPAAGAADAPAFVLRWLPAAENTNLMTLEVTGPRGVWALLHGLGWSVERWQKLLAVYAQQSDPSPELPPMLGTYRVQEGVLLFQPPFKLEPGVTYRAVFDPRHLPSGLPVPGTNLISTLFSPPRLSTPSTVLDHIYPSSAVLPENLLKFYLHFSAPMNRGHIYDHIHLISASGKEIELPFLEIDQELWDPTMTRLTLFIDPGRIKRGVRPLEELGPSLERGKRFTLEIDQGWTDGNGNPLKHPFRKQFRVSPPDREPPNPLRWRVHAPRAGTTKPVEIDFREPMDNALAQRLIWVMASSETRVAGRVAIADQERRWRFTPSDPWTRGEYRIVVATTIEDLAGNNIGKAFEVDLFESVQRSLRTATVTRPFRVR